MAENRSVAVPLNTMNYAMWKLQCRMALGKGRSVEYRMGMLVKLLSSGLEWTEH